MLDYLSVLDPKQIVERRRSGGEISLRQHKYKVALSYETTGSEIQLPPFLCHACNSIPQPSNSISDFRSVLRIVSVFNKLFYAIEAQRDHDCLPVSPYQRAIGLRLFTIKDLGGAVDLRAA